MPPRVYERSEAIRIRLSDSTWAFFEELRDRVRRDTPEAAVSDGDQGTRQVLVTWIEEQVRLLTTPNP